jgi:hypothetical protein
VILFGVVAPLQSRLDAELGVFRDQESVLMAWSGSTMKRLAPGFEGIVADVYWLRTIQYYGGQRVFSTERRFDLVAPLVDITVTLDPRMEVAYRLGALFLSEQPPSGAGRPLEGEKVLLRGVAANPSSWQLAQDLAYFQAEFLKEWPRAADTLGRARSIPGAPVWFSALAATFLQKGGDRATSRVIWNDLLLNSTEDFMRQGARRQLRYLDALDGADRATAFAREFKEKNGRAPGSLSEFKSLGYSGPLADPTGVPFAYDAETVEVHLSQSSRLWRAG